MALTLSLTIEIRGKLYLEVCDNFGTLPCGRARPQNQKTGGSDLEEWLEPARPGATSIQSTASNPTTSDALVSR